MRVDQLGVQLYTLRQHTASDMLGTLRRLAALGVRAVEFAGHGDSSPSAIRGVLEREGVTAIGAHVSWDALERDPERVLAECRDLGAGHVVVPSVPESLRRTAPSAQRLACRLEELGRRAQRHGMRLAYHNHEVEFEPVDGTTVWDVLVRETSAEVVDLELDVYWAAFAGHEPAEVIARDGARIALLHMKDRAHDSRDAPVGSGRLPWQAIVREASRGAVRWYIAEQDNPADAFADVARSLDALRRFAA